MSKFVPDNTTLTATILYHATCPTCRTHSPMCSDEPTAIAALERARWAMYRVHDAGNPKAVKWGWYCPLCREGVEARLEAERERAEVLRGRQPMFSFDDFAELARADAEVEAGVR